jgi:hypothetical protein
VLSLGHLRNAHSAVLHRSPPVSRAGCRSKSLRILCLDDRMERSEVSSKRGAGNSHDARARDQVSSRFKQRPSTWLVLVRGSTVLSRLFRRCCQAKERRCMQIIFIESVTPFCRSSVFLSNHGSSCMPRGRAGQKKSKAENCASDVPRSSSLLKFCFFRPRTQILLRDKSIIPSQHGAQAPGY